MWHKSESSLISLTCLKHDHESRCNTSDGLKEVLTEFLPAVRGEQPAAAKQEKDFEPSQWLFDFYFNFMSIWKLCFI